MRVFVKVVVVVLFVVICVFFKLLRFCILLIYDFICYWISKFVVFEIVGGVWEMCFGRKRMKSRCCVLLMGLVVVVVFFVVI